MSLQDDYNITLETLGIENELDQIEQLKEQLSGYKRMQAECNIANRKLREIKEQIKIFWKAEKADDSFAAIERIEKILEEQECQEQ